MDRMKRINETIKREISRILHKELEDPRLQFVSITRVNVSRDLHYARVYFSVLGDQQKKELAIEGFQSACGLIRKYIGKNIRMRYTPEIQFFYDNSIEISARIDETLEEILHEPKENKENHQ